MGRQGSRILVFHIPKIRARPWPMEVADDSLHIVHNFIVTPSTMAKSSDSHRQHGGRSVSTRSGWRGTKSASAKGTGRNQAGARRQRARAGDHYAVAPQLHRALRRKRGLWPRKVIEESLTGGHALGWGDFDGDGDDELAVGWREKRAAWLYKRAPTVLEKEWWMTADGHRRCGVADRMATASRLSR
jgi:hypothetical protein